MPYPVALTSQEKTDIRSQGYIRRAYVLKTPQSVVMQATIATATNNEDYASVTFGTPSSGDTDDIKTGMTVLIHSNSSDYSTVRFPPTYVRNAPELGGVTSLEIGWQATDIENTDTITVLDDYRLHVKQVRIANNGVRIDYDLPYTPLPPAIHGLQSVYAVNSSTAAVISFAPTVEAMESGAAISTYLWDVGDGTITVGTSASKDITVSFPAWTSGATSGWRWVSLSATDDNDTQNTFSFQVFVGDFNSAAWVIQDVMGIELGSSIDDGFAGILTLGVDAANLIEDNHITVVVDEDKNGDSDPIVSNIAFVGRIKGLTDEETASVVASGLGIQLDQMTSYEMQGYGSELSILPLPEYQLLHKATADDWNEITDASVARSIWYGLYWLTTATNFMSFDLDISTYNNYESIGFSFEQGTTLDSINRLSQLVGAKLVFARSGEATLQKDARLLSTSDRSSLSTVVDFTSDDLLERVSLRRPSRPRIGRIEAFGGSFNTTTRKTTLISVSAPKIPNTIGVDVRQAEVLLTADANYTTASAELALIAANTLAMRNEVETIDFNILHGYWFLIADNNVWYTITYSFPSGVSYTTSDRWLLQDQSLSIRAMKNGQHIYQEWSVSGTLTKETQDEGVANAITYAPQSQPYEIPGNPPLSVPGIPYDPSNAFDDDTDLSDTGIYDGYSPNDPNASPPPPSPDSEVIIVNMASSTGTTMTKTTIVSNTYTVTVYGQGTYSVTGDYATPGTQVDSFSVDSSVGGGANSSVSLTNGENYIIRVAGTVNHSSTPHVRDAQWKVSPDSGRLNAVKIDGSAIDAIDTTYDAATHSYDFAYVGDGSTVNVATSDPDPSNNSGSFSVTIFEASEQTLDADAYFSIDPDTGDAETLSGTYGIALNGTKQTIGNATPNSYSTSHQYTFEFTGTGAQEVFKWLDDDYSDNSGSLTLVIEGEFA